jgi:hypothetical protein
MERSPLLAKGPRYPSLGHRPRLFRATESAGCRPALKPRHNHRGIRPQAADRRKNYRTTVRHFAIIAACSRSRTSVGNS